MKSKFVIFAIISTILVAAIYSSSMSVVFALPPRNGWVETCTDTFRKDGTTKSRTCCVQDYSNGKPDGKPYCTKTCYDRAENEITCPKKTAEEDMVDPGLLGGGTLKDGGTNDTGNNTKGKLNFGPSSPLVDRNESPESTSEQPSNGPGGIAKYTCEGLMCTCQGDVDCNDMFEADVCGDTASCDKGTDSCSCLKKIG